MSHLEYGSVVWVRLGQAWWPGTMTTLEKCPPEFVDGLRKTPVAVVKFFHENEFQDVNKAEHIYPYSCERKEEFIKRGQYINKNQSHGDVDLLAKFESDVVTAEKLTGGDMNILTTLSQSSDTPSNPCIIIEPDLSSDPQSTHLERPQGCMPGEIVPGEPEGRTEMRSSSSCNKTQLIDLGHQDSEEGNDDIEEIEQVPGIGSVNIDSPQTGGVLTSIQSGSYLPNSNYTDVTDFEVVQTDTRQSLNDRETQPDYLPSHSTVNEANVYTHSDIYANTYSNNSFSNQINTSTTAVRLEEQQLRANIDSYSSVLRNMERYSTDKPSRSPEIIELESDPESPHVIEETPPQSERMEVPSEVTIDKQIDYQESNNGHTIVQPPKEIVECYDIPFAHTVIQSPRHVGETKTIDYEANEIFESDDIPYIQPENSQVSESEYDSEPHVVSESRVDITDNHKVTVTSPLRDNSPDSIDDSLMDVAQPRSENPPDSAINGKQNPEKKESPKPPIEAISNKFSYESEHPSLDFEAVPDQELEIEGSISSFKPVSEADPVIESEEDETSMQGTTSVCMGGSGELPNQFDSEEQMVTSSGMDVDEIVDDGEVDMDDTCDSAINDEEELNDDKEHDDEQQLNDAETDEQKLNEKQVLHDNSDSPNQRLELNDTKELNELDLSLDEGIQSSSSMSAVKPDIEEADSSLSDIEGDKTPELVSTSEIKETEIAVAEHSEVAVVTSSPTQKRKRDSSSKAKAKAKAKDDVDSTPVERRTSRRRDTPVSAKGSNDTKEGKRKQDSSETKNKKKKFEDKESSFEMTTDDELPDLIKLSTKKDKKTLKVGELAWVKWRKDWWPSYIKNTYPKKRKFSIVFIGCEQDSGISVGAKNVKGLNILFVPTYVNENQEGFSAALHLCKLFHKLHEQGNTISAQDFFSMSPQAQVALLEKKKSQSKGSGSSQKKKTTKFIHDTTPVASPNKSIFEEQDFKSEMSSRELNKLQSALKARKIDNMKLVRFMKSKKCLEYLWKIFEEEVQCKRHEDYKHEDLRRGLLWTGMGPFHLDDDDDQIMSVIDFLKAEILSKKPQYKEARDYAFRVWLPEALKEALRVIKKVPESEVDHALNHGYRETPVEKKARRLCF